MLGFLEDPWKLAAQLLYGSGLRVMECLRLRVKDIDFGHGTIAIHDAKGGKHRLVPLPKALEPRLQSHLAANREKHRLDLIAGVDLSGEDREVASILVDLGRRSMRGAAFSRPRCLSGSGRRQPDIPCAREVYQALVGCLQCAVALLRSLSI